MNCWRKVIVFIIPFRIKLNSNGNKNPKNFTIGAQKVPSLKSGQVKLAMVAFWDKVISDYDISSIYKAGKQCSFRACAMKQFVVTCK